ncbi:hypothetical protein ACODM8_04805 [Vibrio ostreicida]|uniref:hypothetical protein n=1 Tax=Vibrio ostreicida TaxID=526588 RepID=UPI003B5A984A
MARDFCNVSGFKPSATTKDAIDEINNIEEMSNLLTLIIASIPFFQIFAGRKTYTTFSNTNLIVQVGRYDWELFADTVGAIPEIKRQRIGQVAGLAELNTSGEERKFWRCVRNAVK